MKEFSTFCGIDISKAWIDAVVISKDTKFSKAVRVDNNRDSIIEYVNGLRIESYDVLFCMEHSGSYCRPFLDAALSLNLNVWLEMPLRIKRSLGLTRGKSDAIDALRIADYAFRFSDRVKLWSPDHPVVKELAALQTKRDQLVKVQTQLKTSAGRAEDDDLKTSILALQKAVLALEKKIIKTIKSDSKIGRQHELLVSVPGVGPVVSVAIIVATKGFSRLTDPRKFACYAGIAPFPYASGTTILQKNRISKIGDRRVKALLQTAAIAAVKSTPAIRQFYEKKLAEGKEKFSAYNAVRNKMVAIIMAVVRNDTPYQKEYVSSYVRK